MIVLMVSFLVSIQGLSSVLSSKAGSEVVGTSDAGKVTLGRMQEGKMELDIIGRLARSGAFERVPSQIYAYYALQQNKADRQTLAYVLLIESAREQGIDVTAGDVDSAINAYKEANFPFDRFMDQMVTFYSFTRSQVKDIIANWLMVVKAYQANNSNYSPSREELQHVYVDINSKMQVKAIRIPASDFVSKIPAPSMDKIREQFQALKNRPAGDFTGVDSFRFGYLIPAKLNVAWLMADYNAFARVEQPTAEQIEDYYNKNREMFAKDPKAEKKQYKSLSEVRWEIFTQLQMQMAQTTYAEAVTLAGAAVRDELAGAQAASVAKKSDYSQVMKAARAELVKPADEMLSRIIPVIYIEKAPLAEAINQIASLAQPRLKGISFPYGLEGGKIRIDPGISVSLNAQNITVGDALAKLIKDNKLGLDVGWIRFAPMDNVLFCDALAPVNCGDTGMITLEELNADAFLSSCFSREARATLPMLAASVKELGTNSEFTAGILGPVLQSFNPDKAGEIYWMITKVEPAHAPEELTADIAKEIGDDIRTSEALSLAVKVADEIRTPAQFDEYIKKNKVMPILTEPFSLMILSHSAYGQSGFGQGSVPNMKFCNAAVDKVFIEKAFEILAPKDIAKPYTQASDNLMQLKLPCEDCVVVARRVDFMPALANDFDEQAKEYRKILDGAQMAITLLNWYNLDNIVKRTGFQETQQGYLLQKTGQDDGND